MFYSPWLHFLRFVWDRPIFLITVGAKVRWVFRSWTDGQLLLSSERALINTIIIISWTWEIKTCIITTHLSSQPWMYNVRLQHLLSCESLRKAVLEWNFIFYFAFLVQLGAQQETKDAWMWYDYDLCPFVLALRSWWCICALFYNRS